MIHNRSLTVNFSASLLGLVIVVGLIALFALNFNGQNPAAGSAPAQPALVGPASPRALEAYGARWAGLARTFAPIQAYAARWTGLAELYAPSAAEQAYAERAAGQAEMPTRAEVAYAARWTGIAEHYLQSK